MPSSNTDPPFDCPRPSLEDLLRGTEFEHWLAPPERADSQNLVLCADPNCEVAWAFRDPPTEHYHPRPHGPELPDVE